MIHRCLPLVLLSLLPVHPLEGQLFSKGRWAVEPRVGVAFPTGDFGDVDAACPLGSVGCDYPLQTGAETGWRWEARVHLRLNPTFSLVAGFGKTMFGCSGPFCGTGPDPESRALSLGIKSHLFSLGTMEIWGEGGGALEKFSVIRTLTPAGEPTSLRVWYPWSLGFYAGGGAELALTARGNFFFTPGFRFRFIPADPPDAHADLASLDATYILGELGFKVLLGGE